MKRTREEWLAGLKPGDKISVTFPGDTSPSIGVADSVFEDPQQVLGTFAQGQFRFVNGALMSDQAALLQPVATGSGGSVGQPIRISNIMERVQERMQS